LPERRIDPWTGAICLEQEAARLAGGLLESPSIMRLLAVCLVLLSAPVMAQAIVLTVNGQNTSATISSRSCADNIAVTWRVAQAPCSGDLQVWSTTTGTCGDTRGTNDYEIVTLSASTVQGIAGLTRTESFAISNLFTSNGSDGGAVACGAAQDLSIKVCGSLRINTGIAGCQTTPEKANLTVTYDGTPPPRPTIAEIVPLDSSLSVRVTTGAPDIASFKLYYSDSGSGAAKLPGPSAASTDGSKIITLPNLQNGTTYFVTATVTDEAGNESPESDAMQGVPINTVGGWGAYKAGGGAETGGCSAAGGGLALSVAVLALVRGLSRRRG
jgi:uncharacterized protein (TIGR03382 family)